MSYNVYHWCIVPECSNTSVKTPQKLWIKVPCDIKMRNTWFKLAQRDPRTLSIKSRLYFCEDHFDLPNDMDNYMQYHLMGSVAKVRMKIGCVPTKFECQNGTSREKKYLSKKRKKIGRKGRKRKENRSDENTVSEIKSKRTEETGRLNIKEEQEFMDSEVDIDEHSIPDNVATSHFVIPKVEVTLEEHPTDHSFEYELITPKIEITFDDANSDITSETENTSNEDSNPRNKPTKQELKDAHSEILKNWNLILQSGLSDDRRDKLIKEYVYPKDVLPIASNVNVSKQDQLGRSLFAIGKAISSLKTKQQDVVKILNEAGQLIADSLYVRSNVDQAQ